MGPDPAVAAVRLAVRQRAGGPDRPAIWCSPPAPAAPTRWRWRPRSRSRRPGSGCAAGGVTVDHGLQPGSAGQALTVTQALAAMGLGPVLSAAAVVSSRASRDTRARRRRRGRPGTRRWTRLAGTTGANAVLLGHTRDDQAEGRAARAGPRLRRPLAGRDGGAQRPLPPAAAVRQPRADQGRLRSARPAAMGRPAQQRFRLRPGQGPSPADARRWKRPSAQGSSQALARTARALRADADLLDSLAKTEAKRITGADAALDAGVAALPEAIRTRVLRLAAIAAGLPGRRADRPARGRARRAGDPAGTASAGRTCPAASAASAACGKLTFTVAGRRPQVAGRDAGRPARGGRGWTRRTWAPTSRTC